MQHQSHASWTERTGYGKETQDIATPDIERHFERHAFKPHPHTSLGVAGHIIHMTGVFVPLVAGELVQDAVHVKEDTVGFLE